MIADTEFYDDSKICSTTSNLDDYYQEKEVEELIDYERPFERLFKRRRKERWDKSVLGVFLSKSFVRIKQPRPGRGNKD